MKEITSLTQEQIALMGVVRDEWINIGITTGPANRVLAKQALENAYKNAGLAPPKDVYYATGPLHAYQILKELNPNITKSEYNNSLIYGAHDAPWLSFCNYFQRIGLDCCDPISPLIELAKHSGWVNIFDTVAVIHDRPMHIKFDDGKLLHCETGPAIEYADGTKVYSWHGTAIPGEWIENKNSLTPTVALTHTNIEQRKCACEILGWENILQVLNSKVIDEDVEPEIGTLVEVDIPEIGKEKFLRVKCGTGRMFAIPVPPEMKTALEANSWTYGIDGIDFIKPEIRT